MGLAKRKDIRLEGFNYALDSYVYFLTLCTENSEKIFADHSKASIVIDELNFRISKGEIVLYCYCIMTDHVHFLLSLRERYQKDLRVWVASFKRFTAKCLKEKYGIFPVWQKNFYDHIIRKDESLENIAQYIVCNPVRKGLVEVWSDYPFSAITF
jgi:REP element-mobilizing transposase RayT